MAWQQTRQPNLDPYIMQPNGHGGVYTLTDWLGWCLAYVQTAFGTGWGGSTAWECWASHTVNKHEDRNLPSGVYVPIFFSGYHGQGHTAIYKDGEIWSSPISHKPYADTWGSIAEVERSYGVTFVGWAEGIGGTTVVSYVDEQPVPEPIPVVIPEPTPEPVSPPTPYVPPAAPVSGIPVEEYTLVTSLATFGSAADAMSGANPVSSLSAGKYIVFSKENKAYNLTSDNRYDMQQWVNTLDNRLPKAPDVVTPSAPTIDPNAWKKDFKPFPDNKSRRYKALRDMYIIDYAGVDPKGINITEGEIVPIFGTFPKGGLTYLMPRLNDSNGKPIKDRYYGIPTTSVYTGLPNMENEVYRNSLEQEAEENRAYRRSVHHETTDDKVYYAEQLIKRAVADGVRFLSEVIPLKKLKNLYGSKDTKK